MIEVFFVQELMTIKTIKSIKTLESIDIHYMQTFNAIIGCDEVGRGPIAGPVSACAVFIDQNNYEVVQHFADFGVTDSKKLTQKKRLQIIEKLNIDLTSIVPCDPVCINTQTGNFKFVISQRSSEDIDRTNILEASVACMKDCSDLLLVENCCVLVDGNKTFESQANTIEAIVKGDSKSIIIAMASIIAKEYRDYKMSRYDKIFPGYGLARNSGYPTRTHKQALLKLGPTPIHRKSFKGVKEFFD